MTCDAKQGIWVKKLNMTPWCHVTRWKIKLMMLMLHWTLGTPIQAALHITMHRKLGIFCFSICFTKLDNCTFLYIFIFSIGLNIKIKVFAFVNVIFNFSHYYCLILNFGLVSFSSYSPSPPQLKDNSGRLKIKYKITLEQRFEEKWGKGQFLVAKQ